MDSKKQGVSAQNAANIFRFLSLGIAVLSIVCLLVIIWSIDSNPKLQEHPSRLIFLICLIEGIFCYFAVIESPYVGAGMFTCYFKLYRLTDMTGPFLVKADTSGGTV